ncbi:RecQ family ATP-dependent DNA helicase, partial [bacterium]|nr:RecQ family ATP-dependent DNA helicase [bacterium]
TREHARLLVVQRTGWGKSMIYFIATRILRDSGAGPTLLISPLLSLMRNQLLAADRLNLRAATINSSNPEEWGEIRRRLHKNDVDLLMISPERLANEEFRNQTLASIAGKTGMLVVDEAHCISDWGHDFRPDYRRIVRVLRALPRNVPVLTVTATANDRVVEDVVSQLGGLQVIRGGLGRDSLRLQNIHLPDQAQRLAWLAEVLPMLPGSGIIYTLTVADAKRVSGWLRAHKLNVPAYYGELENDQREELERKLLQSEVKALAATTALGMGFDKPDLHFVIHFQRPASVIHYYQQVGRAGRAVPQAYGILMCGQEDDEIAEYFQRTALPPTAQVEQVLNALEKARDGLTLSMLERAVNLSHSQIEKVLTMLALEDPTPIVKIGRNWHRTPVTYHPESSAADRLYQIRKREQTVMQEYGATAECLMQFLRRELDDSRAEPCGVCANCQGKPLLPAAPHTATVVQALRFLRRNEEIIEPRAQWSGDAMKGHGWKGKIVEGLRAEEGRALCRWGDAGWGEQVRRGKFSKERYEDDLLDGAVEMIRKRWKPEPFPRWVACVPSLRHPGLVPDLAKRLAAALALPFVDCIRKTRETAPQKEMQNSYQQSRNLADSFQVDRTQVRGDAVLLVDDMVDSRWTFTVIAALLREAGSGPVFPFALAKTFSK